MKTLPSFCKLKTAQSSEGMVMIGPCPPAEDVNELMMPADAGDK